MRVWSQDGVELFVAAPVSAGFSRHSHDEYVVSANVCGVEDVRLDGRRFRLGTDELTVYNPGEVQSCRAEVDDGERWSCVSVYLAPHVLAQRLGREVEFHKPLVCSPTLRARLVRLALSPVDETTPARLYRLLDAVLTRADTGPRRDAPEAARARAWLSADASRNPQEPLSIERVATHLGWSRETFTRRFTQATGTPPYAWHLQARLLHARRLLRQGRSPAEAAGLTGFVDQAHLHKLFQAAYATTPAQARSSSA